MSKSKTYGINSKDINRKIPEWAKVVRTVNNASIYNMNIFDNIMSFNQDNLDGDAIDYYGTTVTYGELPEMRNSYAKGLADLGIKEGDVVTLCMPVGIENLLVYFACNCLGAITNNVNFLFLKNDFKLYTLDKKSKVIITLDAYLPYFVENIEGSGVEKIVIMSLDDYLPEEKKGMFFNYPLPSKMKEVFNVEKIMNCLMNLDKVSGVDFIKLTDLYEKGKKSETKLPSGPVDIDRDTTYFYTSGTTGKPKCVVYKEASVNAYIEMHANLDTRNYVGERCFQVIPMTHMTGERVCAINPMARGGTLVPQPIYNKDSFAQDLVESKCSFVVAAASFYAVAAKQGVISSDALSHLNRPGSGGEPVTIGTVKHINEWLKANGCKNKCALGGGASEEGGATLVTYFLNEETKTNETGLPLEPFILTKLLDDNGNEVGIEEYGHLHVSSPASADRYLENEEATKKRWYVDDNGIKWGVTGDIAVRHKNGSFNILGRAEDSYVNSEGKRIYLFDIEYSLDPEDPIIEWEITAFKTKQKIDVVAQIVRNLNCNEKASSLVRKLCEKYPVDAIKFYSEFELGEVTGKRDYVLLSNDTCGYWAPYDESNLVRISYNKETGETIKEIIPDSEAEKIIE